MIIEYDTIGDEAGAPMLLVTGLGGQLTAWDLELCELLAAHGYWVIRFDNRDAGLSTIVGGDIKLDLAALLAGDGSSATYTLDEMADDAVAVLDALGVARAHVVGSSMGGMIAQTLALRYPDRMLSLCSIMSTPGPTVAPPSSPQALLALFSTPPADRLGAIEASVSATRALASPHAPFDAERTRARATAAYDRSFQPGGIVRQLAAIFASGDRTERLRDVRLPTLVIHGEDDQLIPLAGGIKTAEAIPEAELLILPEMGHELPPRWWRRVADAIAANAIRAVEETRP